MAQVGNEHDIAGGAVRLRTDFYQYLCVAHRDSDRHAFPILAQRSGNRLPIGTELIIASVNDKLRRIHGRTAQFSSVNVLPLNRLGQGKPITPAEVIPVVHMKRQGKDVGPCTQFSDVGNRGGT
jgi:hypothetical protein